ncbi:S-layer homology domain-containing protein [Fusibacter bizertensis]
MGLKSNNRTLRAAKFRERTLNHDRYIRVNYTDSFVREELAIERSECVYNKTAFGEYEVFRKVILTSLSVILLLFTSSMGLMISSDIAYADKSDSFTDVIPTHWALPFINSLKSSDIISGYTDGTFKPQANVKINEFIAMTVKALGYRFESLSSDWAKPYVDKAIELKIIEDREFTSYSANITREQMTSIVVNAVALSEFRPSNTMDEYIIRETLDYHKVSDYYKQNILDSYKFGIVTGYVDHTFRPKDYSSRAQAAAVIAKIENTALRTPFEKTDANYVMLKTWVTDEFGNEDRTELPFYAPYYNGQPVDEIVEFARLMNNIHYNGKGYIDFGYDSSLNHLASAFYRDKATYDYVYSLPSAYEGAMAMANNGDFGLTIYPYDLGSKYKPYKIGVSKMRDHTMNYENYSDFIGETYKEQFEDMFKFWFEDEFDTAWAIFERALDHKGERTDEVVEINNRTFDINYSRIDITVYVSLKH